MQFPYLSQTHSFFILGNLYNLLNQIIITYNDILRQYHFNSKLVLQFIIDKHKQSMNQQQGSEDEQNNSELINQKQPQFGQVQGEQIYLGGLDYSLLKQHKQNDKKKGFLDQLKLQLTQLQNKIDSKSSKAQRLQNKIDQNQNFIISTIKQLRSKTKKPLINSSTYYNFDTRLNFGSLTPEIISKRMGKINNQPIYIQANNQTINKFNQIIEAMNKQKAISHKVNAKNQINKSNALKRLMSNQTQSQKSDSDDIFGDDIVQQNQQMPGEKINLKKKLFNFGKGLDFGIKDQDIFITENKLKQNQMQIEQNNQQFNSEKTSDKYDFLRKKVKKSNVQTYDDGYGECYIQTGPSLQQIKQCRKQGIQLFGDAKQFKFKQKKVNIHKDYQKIKKIIEDKSKK